jgi:chitodextrinase
MTVVKRKPDGTVEIVDTSSRIQVATGESVFTAATEAAAADAIDDWESGVAYNAGDVVARDGRLWRVIQAHTSQADWLPGVAWALFAETWASGVIPDWQQPQGAHDAYPVGFEVYHPPTDRVWVSDMDANVWEPNSPAASWTLRDDQEPLVPDTDEWQVGVSYSVGDRVMYNGVEYECRQAHTSLAGWEPPNVPALWQSNK